jgi:F-type H+-transporting ATPase subunit delta
MIITKQVKREAKQLFRLCLVGGSLDEQRVRQVVQNTIAARYRRGHAVLTRFLRLVRLEQAQHTARVESATPLPASLQSSTQSALTRQYGPRLRISFVEQPSLIAGMRIQVGSDVYDASVQAGLARLERAFEMRRQ